jgi:hypothetical protein
MILQSLEQKLEEVAPWIDNRVNFGTEKLISRMGSYTSAIGYCSGLLFQIYVGFRCSTLGQQPLSVSWYLSGFIGSSVATYFFGKEFASLGKEKIKQGLEFPVLVIADSVKQVVPRVISLVRETEELPETVIGSLGLVYTYMKPVLGCIDMVGSDKAQGYKSEDISS